VSTWFRSVIFISQKYYPLRYPQSFTKISPINSKVYPKVPGLAAWSENCKWYSSLPPGAVVSLVNFVSITLCVASQRVFIVASVYSSSTHPETFGYTLVHDDVVPRGAPSHSSRLKRRLLKMMSNDGRNLPAALMQHTHAVFMPLSPLVMAPT
jgi:hypothetical protein